MAEDSRPPEPHARGGAETPAPPEAVVQERSRFSLVWVIPIVAAVVGGFLAWRAITAQGPTVAITFQTGEGIEAGTTKVKYRDIEIGLVEEVALADDLSHVVVHAALVPHSERFLREGTRFWVQRARVSAGEVSGLGTLFSGAYIAVDPVTEGSERRRFQGLERPPAVTHSEPGRRFTLRAETLGSLDVGSPVSFRGIGVGEIVDWELSEDGGFVTLEAFVRAPHDARVGRRTRFWDTSGLDVSVGAEGVRVDTESLTSILVGGVAFDTPGSRPRRPVPDDHVFVLYPSRQATRERIYTQKERYLLRFDGSVKGLAVGSPVVFRGIKVGQVLDLRLRFDPEATDFTVPVLIELEPERIETVGSERAEGLETFAALLDRGLRARLGAGNLLTGQREVELDLFPDAEPAAVASAGPLPVIPTLPTPLEEVTASLERIVARLDDVPLDAIGRDLAASLAELRQVLGELGGLAGQLDDEFVPRLTDTLGELETLARQASRTLDPQSPVRRELERALVELGAAAASLRSFADYVERHPEALLRGKDEE